MRDAVSPARVPGPQTAGDERELARGLAGQEPAAVEEFLGRAHHAVFALAGRITVNADDRRDWCHDALLGILDDMARGRFIYTRPGSFWAWFRKRVWYRLLDASRRARRHEQRQPLFGSGEAGDGDPLPGMPGQAEDPTRAFEALRLRAAVEACLERLPSREQRQALEIIYFQDGTYEDVALALSSPLNTVKAWIRRGRLALRKCLIVSLRLEGPA